MKKALFIAITLCLFLLGKVSAQPIQNYSFEKKIGTYVPITGGTVVWSGEDTDNTKLANRLFLSATESSTEKVTGVAGIPIGFDFTYDNKITNKFVIDSHGLVFLGKDQITADPVNSSTLLSVNNSAAIWENGRIDVLGTAMMGSNSEPSGIAATEISYKVNGTAPNRVLVVQFKDVQVNRSNNTTPDFTTINFQIHLQETTNKIEYVYTGWVAGNASKSFRVALKGSFQGSTNDSAGDNFGLSGASPNWDSANANLTGGALTWRGGYNEVPDNLTYTFIPPADVVRPATQPTGLNLTATSMSVSGSFTATTADRYLVLLSSSPTINNPADGIYYKGDDYIGIGDSIGNARVIAYGPETTFASLEVLSGSTTYYVSVFAVNVKGGFGPKYNTADPLTGQTNTAPTQPGDLKILSMNYNSITLSAVANSSNNQLLIARSELPGVNTYNEIQKYGAYGTPSGVLNVGDEIPGGGTVIYKGSSTDLISQENLNDNTVYHFRAWSVTADDKYSTTFQDADTLTWGKVPYAVDFTKHEYNALPYGWEREQPTVTIALPFQINMSGNVSRLAAQISRTQKNTVEGLLNTVTTQPILLQEGANEIEISLAFQVNKTLSNWVVYNTADWIESDAFEIQLDNGEGFTTIYTISKANENIPTSGTGNTPTGGTIKVPFYNFDGEKVRLRLKWRTFEAVRVYVTALKINAKSCDNVVSNIAVSQIVGKMAAVSWTAPEGDAGADIRYRVAGTEEWSAPIATSTHPFLLTTLPLKSNIELQVRSNCSPRSFGAWSEPFTFFSGYEVPFSEDFNAIADGALPGGWKIKAGSITQGVTDKAIALNYGSALNDSIFLPLLDLGDGSAKYKLDFKLQQLQGVLSNLPAGDYLSVILSDDGGATFSELKKFETATFTAGNYTLPLTGHTGIVQLGFYAESTTPTADIVAGIDDVAVLSTCPPAENVTVSDVAEWSAKLTWDGTADEWLVFVRKKGETEVTYTPKPGNEWLIEGLIPATEYEAGITKSCGDQDTAKVIIVSFTTLPAAPCEEVKNIVITPYQGSASITWESDAANFGFKYRRVSASNWIESVLTANNIRLEDLLSETQYEYSIQAICSNAYGDQSDWVDGTFTTQPVSCFAPTDIKFSSTTHKSTTVSWTANAAEYTLAYRTGEAAWTTVEDIESKTYTITGLVPETNYSVRIRSICDDDISAWATATVTTDAVKCLTPTNLQATGITGQSVVLSWDADDENLTWNVNYREGSLTAWTTVNDLAAKLYLLEDLKSETAYVWRVRAACADDLTSSWANGDFTTDKTIGINAINKENLKVFVSDRIINILNPDGSFIERIQLYDVSGALLKEFTVNSTENVLIPVSINQSAVIVKMYSGKAVSSYKILIK